MSKAKKISLFSVFSIFIVLACAVVIWYFGDTYPQFYKISQKEFEIAGLSEGFVPQGLCHFDEQDLFFYSGYMKDGSASRIYVYDNLGKCDFKYITLTVDGQDYVGHAGGIATDGKSVWVSGDGMLHRFDLEALLLADHKTKLEVKDSKEMLNGADFLKYEKYPEEDQGYLWVGEFHKEGKYDTEESHHIQCSDGSINKALTYAYFVGYQEPCGITDIPMLALSTGSLVQGMEMYGGKVILSTSYGLSDSHIKTYDINLQADQPVYGAYEVDGLTVQLYIADSSNLISDLKAPSMSEEIVAVGNKLYIMFENACKKYSAFTREKLENVFSYNLEQK